MTSRPFRLLLASGAVAMLLTGILAIVFASGSTPAAAAGDYTIDILPDGFNPATCTVNRNNSTVRFRNMDSKPRRIVVPELYAPEPRFRLDTGVIQPGETNAGGWLFSHVDDVTYRDHDEPSLTGKIIVPVSNNAQTSCTPAPPTPTPTNTATPTNTPLPTPPPPPSPVACARLLADPKGCSLAINVTSYGPLN